MDCHDWFKRFTRQYVVSCLLFQSGGRKLNQTTGALSLMHVTIESYCLSCFDYFCSLCAILLYLNLYSCGVS